MTDPVPTACGGSSIDPGTITTGGPGTHHLGVGDLPQQDGQVVPSQGVDGAVQLQAADGRAHAARGDHGGGVQGQAEVCGGGHVR